MLYIWWVFMRNIIHNEWISSIHALNPGLKQQQQQKKYKDYLCYFLIMSGVKLAKEKIKEKTVYYCGGSAWHKKSFSKTPFLQCLAPPPYVGIFCVVFCLCKITSRSSLHHMLRLNFVPWRISIFQAVYLHKGHFQNIKYI